MYPNTKTNALPLNAISKTAEQEYNELKHQNAQLHKENAALRIALGSVASLASVQVQEESCSKINTGRIYSPIIACEITTYQKLHKELLSSVLSYKEFQRQPDSEWSEKDASYLTIYMVGAADFLFKAEIKGDKNDFSRKLVHFRLLLTKYSSIGGI